MARPSSPAVGVLGSAIVGEGLAQKAEGRVDTASVATPYGSVDVISGTIDGARFVAAAKSQAAPFPPHNLPFRATMLALRKSGADRILSVSVATALHESVRLGDCVIPDDFIDLTGRSITFFDGGLEGTHHADMEEPFCARLSREFVSSARSFGLRVRAGGTVATVPGPHHLTPAESARIAGMGALAASFSTATEAKLAREMGACFVAALVAVREAPVHAAWRRSAKAPSAEPASEAELLRAIGEGREFLGPAASRPADARRRGAPRQPPSKETRELEELRASLQSVDERMKEAAAAFVPHAAAFPPCTRCPRGAGPVPV